MKSPSTVSSVRFAGALGATRSRKTSVVAGVALMFPAASSNQTKMRCVPSAVGVMVYAAEVANEIQQASVAAGAEKVIGSVPDLMHIFATPEPVSVSAIVSVTAVDGEGDGFALTVPFAGGDW